MAFAAFGIITPVLSIVLSVFMLGLAIGSTVGGKRISSLTARTRLSGAYFYAFAELMIGAGAFAVPALFSAGQRLLLAAGETNSFGYLAFSAAVLAISLFPWCFFMGTTFPFMMAYLKEKEAPDSKSFSFLYTANVLGAMAGTFMTAIVFIEKFGFHHTLGIAATGNICLALASACLGWITPKNSPGRNMEEPSNPEIPETTAKRAQTPFLRWVLFSTGFCAMAMEVVWTRAFTPVLKTQVYSFALIVFTYLGATFAGSFWYRERLKRNAAWAAPKLMAALALTVFLPIAIDDPRFLAMNWTGRMDPFSAFLLLASICPFCAALGYLTPSLIDNYAGNDPAKAGAAYAINVAGCIIGPLFASYVLLPNMSETAALVILGLPFLFFYLAGWKSLSSFLRAYSMSGTCIVTVYSLAFSKDFQSMMASESTRMQTRRDYAASVMSVENSQGTKLLLVNSVGMTILSSVTKYMAHLPLAFHQGKPQSALIICFGMGTSYRSALSWDIHVTAVELIPDVPKAFGFYHADATNVLRNPKGTIIIDDGRRFLKRTHAKYDVIVVDPPPPVETAGSSLLYSTEMYELLKQHLKPKGIVQVWFPGSSDAMTAQAIVRSATVSFPYVRCFKSINGWGLHIIASMDPIQIPAAAQLVSRMPASAIHDLLEWSTTGDPTQDMSTVLSNEVDFEKYLNPNPEIKITDDRPMNEYFLLRRMAAPPF